MQNSTGAQSQVRPRNRHCHQLQTTIATVRRAPDRSCFCPSDADAVGSALFHASLAAKPGDRPNLIAQSCNAHYRRRSPDPRLRGVSH
jgi:hypothetical protein